MNLKEGSESIYSLEEDQTTPQKKKGKILGSIIFHNPKIIEEEIIYSEELPYSSE